MMKTYEVKRRATGEVDCIVRRSDGRSGKPSVYLLPHHVKHSPTGFEFGYCGSGPTELARCILIDYFSPRLSDEMAMREADRLYEEFKWKFVAADHPSPSNMAYEFTITEVQIDEWRIWRKVEGG